MHSRHNKTEVEWILDGVGRSQFLLVVNRCVLKYSHTTYLFLKKFSQNSLSGMANFENKAMSKVNEENDDDNIVTMIDVLEEEKQLEEDAFAVLGASDDKNCTYSQVSYFDFFFFLLGGFLHFVFVKHFFT